MLLIFKSPLVFRNVTGMHGLQLPTHTFEVTIGAHDSFRSRSFTNWGSGVFAVLLSKVTEFRDQGF